MITLQKMSQPAFETYLASAVASYAQSVQRAFDFSDEESLKCASSGSARSDSMFSGSIPPRSVCMKS